MFAQAILKLGEDARCLFHGESPFHYHVRHENRHAGGNRAGMQIVNGDNMGNVLQMLANLVEVKPLRGLFQQYLDRVGQQLDARGIIINAMAAPATASKPFQPVEIMTNAEATTQPSRVRRSSLRGMRLHIHIVFALRGENKD